MYVLSNQDMSAISRYYPEQDLVKVVPHSAYHTGCDANKDITMIHGSGDYNQRL